MEFSSIVFLFRFLPIFILCYYLVPGGMRNIILLFGSLFFYAWADPVCLLLLTAEVLMGYLGGLWLERLKKGRGALLAVLVTLHLAGMAVLVYGNMGAEALRFLFGWGIPRLKAVAPLGLSLYTFQCIGYLTDVYRREIPAEKELVPFATFVTMFPRSMVGPLQSYGEIAPALHSRKPDILQISSGAKGFCIGFAKKVILGDGLRGLWLEIRVLETGSLGVATAWLGMAAYTLSLYYILSGYTDMALGLGRCLGFEMPENFDYPFLARSITEFWEKWYQSVGGWFRKYLYRPVAGGGRNLPRVIMGVLLVGMLYGLWYGAGWHHVLWGIWFALFFLLERGILGRIWRALPWLAGWIYTMGVLLTGMSLLALDSPGESLRYILAMWGSGPLLEDRFFYMGREYLVLLAIAVIAACPFVSRLIRRLSQRKTGAAMSLYRFGEKIIPPVLFLLALIFMMGRQ